VYLYPSINVHRSFDFCLLSFLVAVQHCGQNVDALSHAYYQSYCESLPS
jgi:hypothetical protein